MTWSLQQLASGFIRDEREIISCKEIKSKVDQLLDNDDCKARALSRKQSLMNSIKEGGSSYKNSKNFIEWIKV